MTTPLYSMRSWRKFRTNYLVDHPLCVHCEARGIVTQSVEVDHIIPVNRGGEVWDVDNLQALCKPCHSKKTASDGSHARSVRGCDVNGVPLDPGHPWRQREPGGAGGGS